MGRFLDVQIRSWIKAREHFEGRADGNGLYLSYRKKFSTPRWQFRYRLNGKARTMGLGTYPAVSLAEARKTVKELRARVTLGFDPASEKQERKRATAAKIKAEETAVTVGALADEYFNRTIRDRWKHPNIVKSRIEKDIKPNLGDMRLEEVRPPHIDAMLQAIVKRGAPTTANDVLRWVRRMFDYAVKRQMVSHNPAAVFSIADAGGKETPRTRWLTRAELVRLFEAMRQAEGFSIENYFTVKLLLLLCIRKQELTAARVAEFNLEDAVWSLPGERTKTGAPIDIPLSKPAIDALRELMRLGCGDEYLLPARKRQDRMLPHIHENTLNQALYKVKRLLPDLENFTIHDLSRRTTRTHLAALGVEPHIAEQCLNHKIPGVEGIYNRHAYFDERRAALTKWANFLESCEAGGDSNVIPLRSNRAA